MMLPSILLAAAGATAVLAAPEIHEYDDSLFHFKSRPDIKAPKYEVEVYNKSAIAPGYWMLGPYETLNMADEVLDGWIGPAIYDSDGMLVYSGAPTFDNSNTEDFKLSNVQGEQMFTLMDQSHWKAVLMDNHYEIKARRKVSGPGTFNSHEFNFVENGTRALVCYNHEEFRSREESAGIGFDGQCYAGCNGFVEHDTYSWQPTFIWDSCGHIALNESTETQGNITYHCGQSHGWDYVHANSIDKTPEGDYLFSARHCDTIYKISHKTGKIIWRLNGKLSDFKMIDSLNFTRQHNIRFRGYEDGKMIVSLLDNAVGEDKQGPSWWFSRGLWLALDEEAMTARIVTQFDHPEGKGHWSNRRGNLQVLTNGNILMGWSERGQISEHLPDGTMVMRAYFTPRWLGTYRSYKQEFVGWPARRPDAAAEAVDVNYGGGTVTNVYASWNGATEVANWIFYKTDPLGHHEMLLGTVARSGFETNMTYEGFAKYVVADAVHANGTVLGRTGVAATLFEDDSTDAAQEEEDWQREVTPIWWKISHNPLFIGSAGLIIGIATLYGLFNCIRKTHLARKKSRARRRALSIPTEWGQQAEDAARSRAPLMEREKQRRRRNSEFSIDGNIDQEQEQFVDDRL